MSRFTTDDFPNLFQNKLAKIAKRNIYTCMATQDYNCNNSLFQWVSWDNIIYPDISNHAVYVYTTKLL